MLIFLCNQAGFNVSSPLDEYVPSNSETTMTQKSAVLLQPHANNLKSESQELSSDVYSFQEENGRTYHGYRPGSKSRLSFSRSTNLTSLAYYFPNDSTEIERLSFEFGILKRCFENKNYFAPICNPQRILDIGTGPGNWAIGSSI